jgi:large subunit ribosomal protein L15
VGFEGGQMPLQRRLPKRGFKSHCSSTTPRSPCPTCSAWARTNRPARLEAAGLVGQLIKNVKVIKSGELTRKVN